MTISAVTKAIAGSFALLIVRCGVAPVMTTGTAFVQLFLIALSQTIRVRILVANCTANLIDFAVVATVIVAVEKLAEFVVALCCCEVVTEEMTTALYFVESLLVGAFSGAELAAELADLQFLFDAKTIRLLNSVIRLLADFDVMTVAMATKIVELIVARLILCCGLAMALYFLYALLLAFFSAATMSAVLAIGRLSIRLLPGNRVELAKLFRRGDGVYAFFAAAVFHCLPLAAVAFLYI